MRRHAMLVVGVVLGLAASASSDDAKTVQEKLQGKWKMVKLTVDGKDMPEEKVKEYRLTVQGSDYEVKIVDRTIKLTTKLLPETKPQAIDLTYAEGDNKGQTNKAIIQIDGDTLKMCRAMQPDQERPTEFASKEGSQLVLAEWKRDKD